MMIYDIRPLNIQIIINFIYITSNSSEWDSFYEKKKKEFEANRTIDLRECKKQKPLL